MPVVLMVHGFADSSDGFFLNGPEKSWPFILAREGYDIWLPNHRGNKYSQRHAVLDSKTDLKYWEHALTFISAKNDLPAAIEHIKLHTGVKTMTAIAHSMGGQ